MKEKLLKLINAAIEETSMYESDYHYVNFKGIKEKIGRASCRERVSSPV